ncbi:MAG: hypothetical protein C4342_08540, partial [Armatimonadota bacterium]
MRRVFFEKILVGKAFTVSLRVPTRRSFNRYSYVGNDPTNFIDPSGLDENEMIFIHTVEFRSRWWEALWSLYWGGMPQRLEAPFETSY